MTSVESMKTEAASAAAIAYELKGDIAVLTIDVPNSKVNTLGSKSMNELNDLIDKIVSEKRARGIVIRSGKEDNFIAGADVQEIRQIQTQGQGEAFKASELGKQVFAKIDQLPLTVVAAINGICLGGGTELALACDYRLGTDKTKIGLPEIKLGFVPGWGGCVRLPKLVGMQEALGMILTGKVMRAKQAAKIGLLDEVVEPADNLLARALEVAGGARPKGSGKSFSPMTFLLESNPIGLSVMRNVAYKAMMRETKGKYPAAKEVFNVLFKGRKLTDDKAFKLESAAFAKLAGTSVSRNLVRIFFAQNDSKKMPAEAQSKAKVTTVGVLGAGVMGAGIAQLAAKAGYKVIVKDVEQRFLDKGKSTIEGLFGKLVERKRMTADEANRIVSEMVLTVNYDDMKGCDLVIEAVIEDLKVKQQALADLEKAIGTDFVFATNTSSLSVDSIAGGGSKPENVVGMHFFNPVHKLPLVEIIRGPRSGPEAVARAMSVALKLDKTTVITADSTGFVVNRILGPYLREAALLAENGVPIPDIDKAMKSFGMPMGPLALLDEIGLDVSAKVLHVMRGALGERMSEPRLLKEIEGLKLLGKKGGKGIYLYNEKGRPEGVNPDVSACIKAEPKKKQAGEIQDRLVLLMLNEAARCIEERVVTDPAQLDLAMVFGTGYPPFQGGILRYADSIGIKLAFDKLDYLSRVVAPYYAPCKLLGDMAAERRTFYPDV